MDLTGSRITALRRIQILLAVAGALAILTSIVLTVIEGVKYRMREEQGLDPIWAPDWVSNLIVAGLVLFVIAALSLAVTGVVAISRGRSK